MRVCRAHRLSGSLTLTFAPCHQEFVRNALLGVENILSHFHMLPLADIEDNGLEPQVVPVERAGARTVLMASLCNVADLRQVVLAVRATWWGAHCYAGGASTAGSGCPVALIRVAASVLAGAQVTDWVEKGQVIATVRNVFGEIQATYRAPEDGIVVGKSVNPRWYAFVRVLVHA